ncbi:MAG TPA: hypothetical protein VMZ73_00600 [Acidimicrobiales bacterium]|nr:hypothetical protein [Acidimicrobiales bacterium]
MGHRARRLPLVLVLAALAGLAGCGDTTKRLTATELAAQGNIVCARSDKKLQNAFEKELGGIAEPSPEQKQAALKRAVPITQETVAELRKLEPPEKLEDRFEEAIEEADRAIVALRRGAASPEAAEALFSAPEDPFAKTDEGLEAVGISTCSQGSAAGDAGAGPGAATFRATEYRYTGPAVLPAGKVTVTLANRGKERHEMNIVRLKPGVTARQVVDAEAAGQDSEQLVADDEVGGVAPVDAGGTGMVELSLVAGTYGYACFVEAGDGQPHVAKGMFAEFSVR